VQLILVHDLLIRAIPGHHLAKDTQVEHHHQDKDTQVEHHHLVKDIIALVPPQARATQVHHLKGLRDIQDRDMEVHLLILRDTEVHHLHSRDMVELHHHNKEEGMVEDPQLMLRFSNGSMLWIKTEVDKLTQRSSREPLSMATGVTSVKRRVG